MKKVAIITEYYNSKNYGGNLQAYALTQFLIKNGYDAEQLCFDTSVRETKSIPQKNRLKKVLKIFNLKRIASMLKKFKTKAKIDCSERNKKIGRFNTKYIKHSKLVYNKDNVKKCVKNYDAFIAGSDQIWNMCWYFPAYFLEFVPANKIKISYAASTTMQSLTEEEARKIKDHLKDFKAVSVREQHAVELLKGVSNQPVIWTLDPTLLFEKEDWEKIASPKLVKEKYAFCYFLGDEKKQRQIAKKYAKKMGLKLVTIPYLGGKYRKNDESFGDVQILDAGVEDFLSLINHAEFVFTDSFHAVVFSGIFRKQYVVFQRKEFEFMASRIYTLCELYETQERFCDTKEKVSIEYIEGLETIDYQRRLSKLNEMKEKSKEYLKENLK